MDQKGYCVMCVAEGAGQDLMMKDETLGKDASGNPLLQDIGRYIVDLIKKHFKDRVSNLIKKLCK